MMMIVGVLTCLLRIFHLSQHRPPVFDTSVYDQIYSGEDDRVMLQQ